MAPGDFTSQIALFEKLAQVFGASVAPILFALWIWFQRPKEKPPDTSPFDKLRDDMIAKMDELKDGMGDIRERVSKIEGRLDK